MDDEAVEAEPEAEEDREFDMDTTESRRYRPRRLRRSYTNQLMLSEWLEQVPEDLAEKWCMVAVPVGQRSLVVASGGMAYQYSKAGRFQCGFPSALPTTRDVSLLDCIYLPSERRFVILDMMVWNGFVYYECDTDFRFVWAQTKVDENPAIRRRSEDNPYPFDTLPRYACDPASLERALEPEQLPFGSVPGEITVGHLDGLLFYHREAHYLPGTTPLVGWLKGYMVPEVLGVKVAPEIMANKPLNYSGMGNFKAEFNARREARAAEQEEKRRNRKEERRLRKKRNEAEMKDAEEGEGEKEENGEKGKKEKEEKEQGEEAME